VNRKDVGLRIRIDKDLREAFVGACRGHDLAASQVLREFMRTFVERSVAGDQRATAAGEDNSSTKRIR